MVHLDKACGHVFLQLFIVPITLVDFNLLGYGWLHVDKFGHHAHVFHRDSVLLSGPLAEVQRTSTTFLRVRSALAARLRRAPRAI